MSLDANSIPAPTKQPPASPPAGGPFDDLYERYLQVFRELQRELRESTAPEAIKRTHCEMQPLMRERFEAEIACGTKLGAELMRAIQR